VQPGSVTVLADTAIRGKDLDEAKATEAKRLARGRDEEREERHRLREGQSEVRRDWQAQIAALRKYRQQVNAGRYRDRHRPAQARGFCFVDAARWSSSFCATG
jgi:hypothetical protein